MAAIQKATQSSRLSFTPGAMLYCVLLQHSGGARFDIAVSAYSVEDAKRKAKKLHPHDNVLSAWIKT